MTELLCSVFFLAAGTSYRLLAIPRTRLAKRSSEVSSKETHNKSQTNAPRAKGHQKNSKCAKKLHLRTPKGRRDFAREMA